MPLTKTLIKHGNSLALVIDKPILELLDITAETPLEVTTEGGALVISPVHDAERADRVRAAADRVIEKFDDDLRRMA